jgi:hypothetical protein
MIPSSAASASSPPTLRATDRVSKGSSISAMLVFYGCARSNTGKCDVFAEFVLVDPEGKGTPAGSGPVWTVAPVSGKLLLSAASLKIGFDQADATGNYGIIAIVTDRIFGQNLTLSSWSSRLTRRCTRPLMAIGDRRMPLRASIAWCGCSKFPPARPQGTGRLRRTLAVGRREARD